MGTILVILSAIGFSLSGVWTTLIRETCEFDVFLLTGYRLMFMAFYCFLASIITKTPFTKDSKEIKSTILFGMFGNVLTLLLYSAATYYISVGLTCLLNFCYPLIVVAISYFMYKVKVGAYKIIASVLMVAGLLLTSGGGSLNLIGFFLGFGSAISFAIYVLSQERSAMAKVHGFQVGLIAGGIGAVALIAYSLINSSFMLPTSGKTVLYLALGALTSNFAPIVCLSEGMKRNVSAAQAGFLCILEPACSLIWDFLIFKTTLTPLSIAGVVIIFASFFVTLKDDNKQTAV